MTSCEVYDLTQKLKLALKETDERRRRGLNARQLVLEKYSWPSIAKQTIQVYQQILADPAQFAKKYH